MTHPRGEAHGHIYTPFPSTAPGLALHALPVSLTVVPTARPRSSATPARPLPPLHRTGGEIWPTPVSPLAAPPGRALAAFLFVLFFLGRGDAGCNRFPRGPCLAGFAWRLASRAGWAPGWRRPARAGGPDLAGGASRQGEGRRRLNSLVFSSCVSVAKWDAFFFLCLFLSSFQFQRVCKP